MDRSSWDPLCDLVEGWHRRSGGSRCVGVAGGVATGKSTVAARLAERGGRSVAVLAADDFLWSNHELDRLGLSARKGHPETYRTDALAEALGALLNGQVATVPVYSHRRYDIVPDESRRIDPADLVVVEGLHVLADGPQRSLVGLGVFLDAPDDVAHAWYHQRIGGLIEDARRGEESFYRWAVDLEPATVTAFLDDLWNDINLPLLREHIAPGAAGADLVVHLDASRHMAIDIGGTVA